MAISLNSEDRETQEIILHNDKASVLVHNPKELEKSMDLDLSNNELVSDIAFGRIMTALICQL
jgi:hypothetical protein